jgi:hypothetical protein
MYYLQPRSQQDLRGRDRAHRKIAGFCFGPMAGPFAGNLTGLPMRHEVWRAARPTPTRCWSATSCRWRRIDIMKLFKLAWDLVGPDHASRATSYDKFFVGPLLRFATTISSRTVGRSARCGGRAHDTYYTGGAGA